MKTVPILSTSGITERTLYIIYAFFIFSSTFSIAAGSVAGGVASLLFLVIAVQNRFSPINSGLKWFYVWAGVYVFWLILASQVANPGLVSLKPIGREWMFFLVPAGIWIFRNDRIIRPLLAVFAVGVAIISLYSIGQFFWGWHFLKPDYPPVQYEHGYWISGNFTSSVTFGVYYGTAGLFLFAYGLRPGWKRLDLGNRLCIATGLFAMTVAVLSNERGPALAVLLTLIVLAFLLRSKTALVGIGVALGLLIAIGLQSGLFARSRELMSKELSMRHDRSRLFIWTYSLRVAQDHPFVGVGPGHMSEAYARVMPADIPDATIQGHAHNDLLTVAAEGGFPCAAFLLALWVTVLGYCLRAYRSTVLTLEDRGLALGALAGTIAYFVSSMFDTPFAGQTSRQMLMFVWAAGLAMYLKSKSGPAHSPNDLTSRG